MAYTRKLISKDENLIGIARLHWIYVLRGLFWFLVFAIAGWAVNWIIVKAALAIASGSESYAIPATLSTLGNGAMFFLIGGGCIIFFLFVLKVLVTEIALTSRRLIHKEGLIFVKTHQIDQEEIRGENLDLGYLGRFLGYGYLMLDCRFIGDVRLPAIENPERFLRALHEARSASQDSLSIVRGKGNTSLPIDFDQLQQPDTPQPAAPQPTPEIQPGQMPAQPEVQPGQTPPAPEIPTMPTPHGPPPAQGMPAAPPVVAQSVALDPQAVAQVVAQVMPQMAEQVVKQMAQQGLIGGNPENEEDKDVDSALTAVFDEASFDKDGTSPHDHRHRLEHAIH
jgi:hypothetical protein